MAGTLDNVDHNPSSTAGNSSFHGTSISIIQQPTNGDPGIYGTQSEIEMVQTNIKPWLSGSYTPVVSMKAVNISVSEKDNTSYWLHITPQSNLNKSIHLPVYTTLAHEVSLQTMHPHTGPSCFLGLKQALLEEPLTMGKPNFNTLILIDRFNLLSSGKVSILRVTLYVWE